MIDSVTTQAAPVVREVGAKAAELAAVAGGQAGPVAHPGRGRDGDASEKLAERPPTWAAELRRASSSAANGADRGSDGAETATGGSVAVASADESTAETGSGESIDQPGV